jgi:hypothetical protein
VKDDEKDDAGIALLLSPKGGKKPMADADDKEGDEPAEDDGDGLDGAASSIAEALGVSDADVPKLVESLKTFIHALGPMGDEG